MGRVIVIVLVLGAVGGGVYYFFVKGKSIDNLKQDVDTVTADVSGYPHAKTPKEAVDLFTKAIGARKYDMAAKYCTSSYAAELKGGSEHGKKFGEAIDDLSSQMQDRTVLNDELRWVLFFFDPFPKDFSITIDKPTETEAVAVFTPPTPKLTNQQITAPSDWKIDNKMLNALYPYRPITPAPQKVKMTKDAEGWKFDFPDSPALQEGGRVLANQAKYYADRLKVLSGDLKRDATSQSDFKTALKKELEEARTHTN